MASTTNKMTIRGFMIMGTLFLIETGIMINMTSVPLHSVFSVIKYYLIWTAVPYVVMSFFLLWHLRSTPRTVVMDCIAISLVLIIGLLILIIEHSGWEILVLPLLQVPAFILVRFLLYLMWENID